MEIFSKIETNKYAEVKEKPDDFTVYTAPNAIFKSLQGRPIANNEFFELHLKIWYMNQLEQKMQETMQKNHLNTNNTGYNPKKHATKIEPYLQLLKEHKTQLQQNEINTTPRTEVNLFYGLLEYEQCMIDEYKSICEQSHQSTDTRSQTTKHYVKQLIEPFVDNPFNTTIAVSGAFALLFTSILSHENDNSKNISQQIQEAMTYKHMIKSLDDIMHYSPLPIIASASIPDEELNNLNKTNTTETQLISTNNTIKANRTTQLANTSINEAPPTQPTNIAGNVKLENNSILDINNYTLEFNINNLSFPAELILYDNTNNSFYTGSIPADNPITPEIEGGNDGDIIEFFIYKSETNETFRSNNTTLFVKSADIYPANAYFTDTIPPIITENHTISKDEGKIAPDIVTMTLTTNEPTNVEIEKNGIQLHNESTFKTNRTVTFENQERGINRFNITAKDKNGNIKTKELDVPIIYLTGNITGSATEK